jgi:adenylate kinase
LNLVLIGPPGAGKGTQSALLGERLRLASVSTGHILREEVRCKSPLGLEAKRHMDKGELVPDDVIMRILEERLRQPDCEAGFILDGVPRTMPQAEWLDRALTALGRALDIVISIIVPDEELIKRLSGRRTCRECGAMHHIIFDPPTNAGICNKCNGDLYQRDDDHEDIIASRLEVYVRATAPVLQLYRTRNLLAEVDGTGSRDDILGRIVERLERLERRA